MAIPPYPRAVLPQVGWKNPILSDDIIKSNKDAVLGHMLEGTEEKCIDKSLGEGMDSIRRDFLPLKRMANLSCSLFGTCFIAQYFHFLPQEKGEAKWNGNLIEESLMDETNYRYIPEMIVVGWLLRAVHLMPLPYPRTFVCKTDYDRFMNEALPVAEERKIEIIRQSWEELKAETKAKQETDGENETNKTNDITLRVVGESHVNHDPTMLNYWHFTIDLYSANDNKNAVNKISRGWREKMAINLQDYLCHNFFIITESTKISSISDNSLWVKV